MIPFLLAIVVGAFTLTPAPGGLTAPLAPGAFNAGTASSTLAALAAAHPDRTPGSPGDFAVAAEVAGAFARDGFTVVTHRASVATTSGTRTVETVVASRAGSAGRALVLLADRSAAARGSAAQLSGTAALLELADALRNRLTRRPIVFVSTSGGPAGEALAASELPGPVDAAILIGDVAGRTRGGPAVIAYASSGGLAPLVLRRTIEAALGPRVGAGSTDAGVAEQLARLAVPLTAGGQGLLGDAGLSAVLVQESGERAPAAGAPVSTARLGAYGQGILAAISALDAAPALPAGPTRDVSFGGELLSGGAVRIVSGLLLLSLVVCVLDFLARTRRHGGRLLRPLGWVLASALPFLLAAAFAWFLGWGGLLPAAPPGVASVAELPIGAAGTAALASVALLFALGWPLRAALVRRGGLSGGPGAAAALLVVGSLLAVLVWIANPYTALLLALALHVWLLAMTVDGERPLPRALGLLALLISLAPLAAVLAIEASALSLGPLGFAWAALIGLASGSVGLASVLAWTLAAGGVVAAASILLRGGGAPRSVAPPSEVTVRGPRSYAGPGSLGGTESALRR